LEADVKKRLLVGSALSAALLVSMPGAVGAGELTTRGDLVITPTTVVIGQTFQVSNADDMDSRCYGDGAVAIEQFGVYMSALFSGDDEGDWTATIEVTPTWGLDNGVPPTPRVTAPGTYDVVAFCFGSPVDAAGGFTPAQQAPFDYNPGEVTLVAPTTPTSPTTAATPTTAPAPGASPATAARISPRFTG
jgi:hypothetical protein